jgi:ketosteroid isomerase-like protein
MRRVAIIPAVESAAVALIRTAYDALNEGRPDWAAENLPLDFELVLAAGSGIPGRFVGAEGVARFFAEIADAWETLQTDVEQVLDLGDRVVVLGRTRYVGRGSGIELDSVAAHLWTVEDGIPVRLELIGDRDEALRRGHAESSQ